MSSKYSSTKEVKDAQEAKVEAFTDDYYAICAKHGMQIVQSPLALGEYKKPEPPPQVEKPNVAV
jgi:hypothetical protein